MSRFPTSSSAKRRLLHQKSCRAGPLSYEKLEPKHLLAAAFYTFESPSVIVTMDNLIGEFSGATFADDATIIDTTAVLEDPSNPDPPGYDGPVRAVKDKLGNTLYPVDTEFGFYVEDFVGAEQKVRDGYYGEGWVGHVLGGQGEVIGLSISNSETDFFASGNPFGTWAAGLGGNTVKASTEHYVVMQNVLSDQLFPDDPNALYTLDNNLLIRGGKFDGLYVADVIADLQSAYDNGNHSVDVFPYDAPDGVIDIRDVLTPNESTVTENIAFGRDYSVTLKDDGKILYRWGQVIKKPNDIRLGVQVDVPYNWGLPTSQALNGGRGYEITNAELMVTHAITNNPNDQIRPEDIENEAATGRKPAYIEIEHPDHPGDPDYGLWVARYSDFTGSGDFLPSYYVLDADGNIVLDGSGDPIVNVDGDGNPIGTIFREIRPENDATTTLTSSDLEYGFTNEWYTTMDRDPFEGVFDQTGDYVVGPRWRLKANKFGQDLPGVEIPLIPHSEPPFTHGNIKYEVGELTTTTINLLDWAAGEDSPLLYSNGWINADPALVNGDGVTVNGLKLTDKFDVALYVKGDRKATQIYDVKIKMDYAYPTTPNLSPAKFIANSLDLVTVSEVGKRAAAVPFAVVTNWVNDQQSDGFKFTDRSDQVQERRAQGKVGLTPPVLKLADAIKSDSTNDTAWAEFDRVFEVEDNQNLDINLIEELFAVNIE